MAGNTLPWIENWLTTLEEIKEGAYAVNFEAIAQALRGDEPVPRAVRDYLATLFEEERIVRPAGKPPASNWFERENDAQVIITTFHKHYYLAKANKVLGDRTGTPHELALESACAELNDAGFKTGVATIRKVITRFKREGYNLDEDPFLDPSDRSPR